MNCLCCGNSELEVYLDLGIQPLANDYDNIGGKYPLCVAFCYVCSHSQLTHFVDPHVLFDNYYYITGVSPTFRDHFAEMAKNILNAHGGKTVLDIGCNDGTLLAAFKELGCEVHGVDPAANLADLSGAKGIPVSVEYWDENSSVGKFDIITATNVFAHSQNPRGFLIGCKNALNDNGVIVIEFPYIRNMIEGNAFDIVYHEHASYFTIKSLNALIESVGLKVDNISLRNVHGGSIRVAIKKETPWIGLSRHISAEDIAGLHGIDAYRKFRNNIAGLKMREYEESVGYGAAAKCTVTLNYLPMNLKYVADDNQLKWGKKIPGTDILIVDPKQLAGDRPPLITVCAWNLWHDIVNRVRGMNFTTKLRRYIPEFQELEIREL